MNLAHSYSHSISSSDSDATELTPFEQLRFATDIIRQKSEALARLSKKLPDDFQSAAEMIFECSGSVIVTGIGKAGWIGQKVSASFASTGTRSHFLHPAEAIHGDLGRISEHDIVLAFSNSGETGEVNRLLPTIEKIGAAVVAVTGGTQSTLVSHSALVLNYGITVESCHLGLAPSTSTSLMLALGDALALVVSRMKNFSAPDFARFHPGGSLGKRLSTVEEIMRPLNQCRIASEIETVREIYTRFSGKDRRAGVVLVTDVNGVLTGLFTDSDLARLLERQQENQFDKPITQVMTKKPITVRHGEKTMLAVETLATRNLSELPVIDSVGKPLGLIDITDVISILPADDDSH